MLTTLLANLLSEAFYCLLKFHHVGYKVHTDRFLRIFDLHHLHQADGQRLLLYRLIWVGCTCIQDNFHTQQIHRFVMISNEVGHFHIWGIFVDQLRLLLLGKVVGLMHHQEHLKLL